MNKTYLKNVGLFFTGFVVGGALMFKVAMDRFNKELSELDSTIEYNRSVAESQEDEFKKMRSYIKSMNDEPVSQIKESTEEFNTLSDKYRTVSTITEKPELKDIVLKINSKSKEFLNLSNLKWTPSYDPEAQYEGKENMKTGIFEITANDYFNNDPEFEQLGLTYYSLDNILVDEKSVVVPNPEYLLGNVQLEDFADKQITYFRNHEKEVDLEIVITDESYYESVLGPVNTPANPKNAKPGRPKKVVSKES